MLDSKKPASLLEVLERKILPTLEERPFSEQQRETDFVVARPTLAEFLRHNHPLPANVHCTKRPLRGRRVAMRGHKARGERVRVTAVWPDDNMLATTMPVLICSVRGQVDFRIGNYILHAQPGCFCLLPPEVPRSDGHNSHLEGARRQSEECDLLWLRPRPEGLDAWICHSQGSSHWSGSGALDERSFVMHPEALGYFTTLLRESLEQRPGWQNICHSLLVVLFMQLHRQIAAGHSFSPHRATPEPGDVDVTAHPIAYAQRYVGEHLQEPLTIERMARTVYLARTQFATQFRRETGQTFNRYLTQSRLHKAKALLRENAWSITAIAHLVGVNPSHLRRLFIQHTGQSPQEFQRHAGESDATASSRKK